MCVPRHGEVSERIARIIPFIHGEKEPAVIAEHRIGNDIADPCISGIINRIHILPHPAKRVIKIFLLRLCVMRIPLLYRVGDVAVRLARRLCKMLRFKHGVHLGSELRIGKILRSRHPPDKEIIVAVSRIFYDIIHISTARRNGAAARS